jgi:hypothetical protein
VAAVRAAGVGACRRRHLDLPAAPSLLSLFGAWPSLTHLDWPFALLALVAGCAAGNAIGPILPGGGVTPSTVSASMLHRAGFDIGDSVAALATSFRVAGRDDEQVLGFGTDPLLTRGSAQTTRIRGLQVF